MSWVCFKMQHLPATLNQFRAFCHAIDTIADPAEEDSEPQGRGGLSPGGVGGQYQHGPGLQDVLRTNLGPNTQ